MKLRIHSYTYLYLSVLLFLIPLPWLLGWVSAVCFHELCHWAAVKLCGGKVYSLTFGLGGAQMSCAPLSEKKKIIATLSGPIGGFLPVFLGKWFPALALCSWVLTVYNLIPIRPLDGGCVLEILTARLGATKRIEYIIMIFLTAISIYSSVFLHLGVLPVAIAAGIWIRNIKFSCKAGQCKVQ